MNFQELQVSNFGSTISNTNERTKEWRDLVYKSAETSNVIEVKPQENEKEIVFTRRSDLKILTSKLAMHIMPKLRGHLFDEIDRLYDDDHYDEGDNEDIPVSSASFRSFLRFLIFNGNCRNPSLGVSEGNLLAFWGKNDQKLFLRFLANDQIIMNAVKEKTGGLQDVISCCSDSVNVSKIIRATVENDVIFA